MKSLTNALGFTAAMALVLGGSVGAATLDGGMTPGVFNTIEDQDREAYIDVDASGTITVGDVFLGFVRLDDFLPAGISTNNQVYGVISNQITAVNVGGDATIFSLGTTTAAGLTLADLTGDSNATGGMFAIYDSASPYGTNLIQDAGLAGANIFELIDYIVAGGDLRLTVGLSAADDYLMVENNAAFPAGSSNSAFPTLPASVTVNSFTGGLSVLYNNTNFIFADAVATIDALGGIHTTQIGIGNGATRGAYLDGNESIFTNAPGYTQCTVNDVNTICGFVTDADFFAVPYRVPEPGSLALMGIAALGMAGVRRRMKKA